jgi:hypothetical protein
VATLAGEGAREACQVARRRLRPPCRVGIAAVHVHEKASERTNVLVVVPDDVHQWPGLAEAEVVEVAGRNLPAGHVGVPAQAEQLGFDRRKPSVGHPVAKDSADERQQVQVTGVEWRVRAGHPVARDQERPIEASAVVGDQPAVARDVRGQLAQQCRLIGVVGKEELNLPEAAALPPAEPDEERQRAGSGGQARRLGIEAEEGSIRRRLARQRRETRTIDR